MVRVGDDFGAARRRSGRKALVLALLATSLAGCASIPSLGPKPEVATADRYASGRSLAGASADWPQEHWWTDFGDPQLDQLVDEALKGSPNVDQAAARIRLAAAQTDLARAALLPKAGLLATARYSRITQSIGLPTDGQWHLLGAGLVSGSFDIDLWGKNRAALRAAVSDERASEADAAMARLTLSTAVASSYADLSQLYLRRDVAAEALRVRSDTLDLVTRRFNAGIDPRTAMEQAQAGVDGAKGMLASIDEAIALSRNAVAALLGAGPDRGLDITRPKLLTRRANGVPTDAAIGLLGRRPDLVSARWRVEAQGQRIGVARAGFYPNVSLQGLIGLASFGLTNFFNDRSVIGSAGPAISLPLFDGGRLRANYRGARASYDAAVATYDQTLLEALHDTADALTSLRALEARQKAADDAVASQEAAYRLARMRYEGGLSDYQSVLIVENALLDARDQAAALRLRGFVLDIELAKALGGGFQGKAPGAPDTPLNGAKS